MGSCKGLDVGFPLPVVVGSRVGSPVGISLEGNIVVGASVGDWLGGGIDVGFLVLVAVGFNVDCVCGCPVGLSPDGSNVEGAFVGAKIGSWLCGCRVGRVVTTTLGAAIGDGIGGTDEGTAVEGCSVVGFDVSIIGRLVGAAGGNVIGDFVIGS